MNKTKKILAGVLAVAVSAGTTCSITYADRNKTDYKKEEHPYNCDNLCTARYHNIQHSQLQCIYEPPDI